MFKNLLIKWHSTDGTKEDGVIWYAINLLSSKYNKDMSDSITSLEVAETTIKALHYKHLIKTLYWWIRYGFKCNKMYWYSR